MLDQLISFITSNFISDKTELLKDTKLISSGLIDSINTLKLVDFVEETFGVEFEANEVSREYLDTPQLILDLINRKLKKQ